MTPPSPLEYRRQVTATAHWVFGIGKERTHYDVRSDNWRKRHGQTPGAYGIFARSALEYMGEVIPMVYEFSSHRYEYPDYWCFFFTEEQKKQAAAFRIHYTPAIFVSDGVVLPRAESWKGIIY